MRSKLIRKVPELPSRAQRLSVLYTLFNTHILYHAATKESSLRVTWFNDQWRKEAKSQFPRQVHMHNITHPRSAPCFNNQTAVYSDVLAGLWKIWCGRVKVQKLPLDGGVCNQHKKASERKGPIQIIFIKRDNKVPLSFTTLDPAYWCI
ncbi:hypothetical protein Mapa_009063 [Marchantia paleacea]|nr:hypothetical protein Mapa_009063 [Marchantia paleacea]